jgi:hypothetical protein
MEIKFAFEKATKNTFRFEELSTDPIIGYLYVKKGAFNGRQPSHVIINLEVAE